MTRPATLKLLFNASGVAIALVIVGYILYTGLEPETETSCHARYPAPIQMSLRTAQGTLLTPIELQARAGLLEWGTSSNASVVPQGADGSALKVKLATLTEIEGGVKRATNGIHFNWKLPAPPNTTSACLSYVVWLPKDFAFEDGGVLPGILGGVPGETGEATRFATRTRWTSDGDVELDAALPGADFRQAAKEGASLQRGQWTRIEQEVVLNKPDRANGLVRMWIDGEQAGERKGLVLRQDAAAQFMGVRVDVGYLHDPAASGELRLTQFQLSWR